jgi:hypothetical protein
MDGLPDPTPLAPDELSAMEGLSLGLNFFDDR